MRGGADDPKGVLETLHRELRRGDFGEDLIDTVAGHATEWMALPAPSSLKALYVCAEVYDYFGRYGEAEKLLQAAGPEHLRNLGSRVPPVDLSVAKWRIWVVMAYATSLYRAEQYPATLAALDACGHALKALDPDCLRFFGTRARLAHSFGQVYRQLHRYQEARRCFEAAVVLARQRLVAKTPYAELPSPEGGGLNATNAEHFRQDSLLAQWTIGKCLALGLGWIAYTTGLLSPAAMLLSAGYTLLRGTGDRIHRAYAKLLLGAVDRARVGDDPKGLASAVRDLEDAAGGLRTHPVFSLRAHYELALAYYKLEDCRPKARLEIAALLGGLKRTSRSARWMSAAMVVQSRIERLDGNLARARNRACEAVDWAMRAGGDQADILAEAEIALGEASLELARTSTKKLQADMSRQDAIASFQRAMARAGNNQKIAAVCHLHLALAHHRSGAAFQAVQESSAAGALLEGPGPTVEHGFVRSLAKRVSLEIDQDRYFFLDGRGISLKESDHVRDLQRFLFRHAQARGRSAADMGISEKTARKRRQRLGISNPPGRPRKAPKA